MRVRRALVVTATVASTLFVLTGCDQGKQHDQRLSGPHVTIVAANVGPDQKLPANGIIQVSFDRMLLPVTITRQSFVLLDSSNQPVPSPIVTYDPVARVVSLSNPQPDKGSSWLTPDQPYKLELLIPPDNEDTSGLRAIDRATLDPAKSHEIGFMVTAPAASTPADPAIAFCRDVFPIFQNRCAASFCHGTPQAGAKSERFPDGSSRPAAGLVLDTSIGVRNTAIGPVSHGSNTGPKAGAGSPPGHVFGVDMPIVDPGDPGNSWLMYKLLLAPLPTQDGGVNIRTKCDNTPGDPPVASFGPGTTYAKMSDAERARLTDYILGNQMPYPPQPGKDDLSQNLSLDELQRVRAWIAQGAAVDECGACQP